MRRRKKEMAGTEVEEKEGGGMIRRRIEDGVDRSRKNEEKVEEEGDGI